jgi:hypothetical protein
MVFSSNAQSRTVTVISEKANLRGTPSPTGKVVEQVSQDEVFELITSKGAWYLVQTSGFVGWLNGNTIKLNFEILASEPAILQEQAPQIVAETPAQSSRTETIPPTTTLEVSDITSEPESPRTYITGERGGCYYINSNGNKTYVDRSLCGTTTTDTTPTSSTSTGTVQVRGYYRKDGTYVRPHTRSAPGRRN